MNGKLKNQLITVLEYVVAPVVVVLAVLQWFSVFSIFPSASPMNGALASGKAGVRFSGFWGNKTVTITIQTEPAASHGLITVSGVPVNGLGTGTQTFGTNLTAGVEDVTVKGDQTGAHATCKVTTS